MVPFTTLKFATEINHRFFFSKDRKFISTDNTRTYTPISDCSLSILLIAKTVLAPI